MSDILRLKLTKFDFCSGSAPDARWGIFQRSPRLLLDSRGHTFKGKENGKELMGKTQSGLYPVPSTFSWGCTPCHIIAPSNSSSLLSCVMSWHILSGCVIFAPMCSGKFCNSIFCHISRAAASTRVLECYSSIVNYSSNFFTNRVPVTFYFRLQIFTSGCGFFVVTSVGPTTWGTRGNVPPLLQMAGHGRAPWVEERQTRNWLHCIDHHERAHQNDCCAFRAKKVEGHDQKKYFPPRVPQFQ